MKKVVVIFALLLASAATVATVETASAQKKGFTVAVWHQTGFSMNAKRQRQSFTSVDLSVAPGYAFNSTVSLRAQLDGVVGLWSAPDLGTWDNNRGIFSTNMTLGPSVAVNLMKNNREWGFVDATATVGHSLFVRDWSYMYYDIGFDWALPHLDPDSDSATRIMVGVGVRYMDTHKTHINDFLNFNIRLGVRFN
jgi:hypothetical protein